MYPFLRSILFRLDAESAHRLTLFALRIGGMEPVHSILKSLYSAPSKPVQAFGLNFKNPVGLAAGYDKDAVAIRGLAALGFGHIEIGTVTPEPQPGNPRPRLFRLVEDEAVINRMGFPSRGADFVVDKLKRSNVQTFKHANIVLGVNLGKNKNTPLEEAANDYLALMRRFMFPADYLTINISSPNTVGLRRLQGRDMLEGLLGAIQRERETIVMGRGGNAPILVKLSPDLGDDELEDAVGVTLDADMDGIIATNTTLSREGLRSKHRGESGGLSGSPLAVRSEAVLSRIVRMVHGRVPIVSAGGIASPEEARKRLAMGASLVQVYTGLIYRGPGLVRDIVKAL